MVRFRAASPKQLQVDLFDELGMPKTKRTKTGYTTDADALRSLFDKTGHPFTATSARPPRRHPAQGAVDGVAPEWPPAAHHTTFQQTIAATGRLSRPNPTSRTSPIPHRRGPADQDAFVVRDGYAELMTASYSKIEMRIMAHLSGTRASSRRSTPGGPSVRRVPGVRRAHRQVTGELQRRRAGGAR